MGDSEHKIELAHILLKKGGNKTDSNMLLHYHYFWLTSPFSINAMDEVCPQAIDMPTLEPDKQENIVQHIASVTVCCLSS